jgi:hypothetical protein
VRAPTTAPLTAASASPTVDATGTPGYHWLVAADGTVTPGGNASFYGDLRNVRLNQPIVGIEEAPSGLGYRLVGSLAHRPGTIARTIARIQYSDDYMIGLYDWQVYFSRQSGPFPDVPEWAGRK